jgi:hypothetical protein
MSTSRFVARLLLVTIMCSASSRTVIMLPMALCTAELASRPDWTRNGLPSAALRNRFRTWIREYGSSRPCSMASNTPSSTGTLMVLAAWNQRSLFMRQSMRCSKSWTATASAAAPESSAIRWIVSRSVTSFILS